RHSEVRVLPPQPNNILTLQWFLSRAFFATSWRVFLAVAYRRDKCARSLTACDDEKSLGGHFVVDYFASAGGIPTMQTGVNLGARALLGTTDYSIPEACVAQPTRRAIAKRCSLTFLALRWCG